METLPIERDPRFKKLLDHYSLNIEKLKKVELSRFSAIFSFVTAPFFTIAASMQLSVKAHENLYGKPGQQVTSLKELVDKTEKMKRITSDEKAVVKTEADSQVKIYKSGIFLFIYQV